MRAVWRRLDPTLTGAAPEIAKVVGPPSRRWVTLLLGLMLLVVAGGAAVWSLYFRSRPPGFEGFELPDKPSIAVLPFQNMSGDAGQEYFSDGMTEDLITDLSKLSGLFVIARNSVFAYKGKAVKPAQVSRELGVRYVLEGSVRKAGNRVRITAQLVDATTGYHVWAERYDRDLKDVFALQDEVTQKIVRLAVKLTVPEEGRLTRTPTGNLEAYDYVLRGMEYHRRTTREANAEARKMFARAVNWTRNMRGRTPPWGGPTCRRGSFSGVRTLRPCSGPSSWPNRPLPGMTRWPPATGC